MAAQGRRIDWVWIVLSCCVVLVLGPRRTHTQITEGPSIISPSCNEEVLISVKNTTSGIEVNVANKHDKGVLESREFSHHLSSQCGEYNVRCKDLLVESSTSPNKSIVFVPLLDGIFLLEVSHRGKITDSTKLTINAPVPCSPTAISKIQENIIAVCLNEERGYLTTMKIYLNTTSISSSRGSRPQIPDFNFGHSNSPHLSDFKYIQDLQWILFASSNHVYTLLPLTYTSLEFSDDLGNCSRPESIVYTSDGVLIAYCHDFASYYSVAYEHAFNQSQYSKHGQPFLCPNPDVHVAVFASASYILYRVWSANSRETINIHDMKFDSGVCFGSRTRTLFAYNDKERGVYVLDPATSNLTHLSSKACLNSHCEPLLVFQSRYIVIRERENNDGNVIVVDSQQNYTAVITAEHVKSDFLTLLIEQDASFCSNASLSPSTNSSLSPSTPTLALPPSGKQTTVSLPAVIGGTIGSFLFLIVGLIIVFTVYVSFCRKSPYPVEESQKPVENGRARPLMGGGPPPRTFQPLSCSDARGVDSAECSPVGNGHVISNPGLNVESHGNPAYQQLPTPQHVYPSSETASYQPPHEEQQNNPHTQGSSDVTQLNGTSAPVTGDSAIPSESAATNNTTPEQVPGGQQASACAHSDRESLETLCTSSETSLLHGAAIATCVVQPKLEDRRTREYDSDDELAHGKEKTVPPRKSVQANRQKMRRRRAEKGDCECCDYENLRNQIVMEELDRN